MLGASEDVTICEAAVICLKSFDGRLRFEYIVADHGNDTDAIIDDAQPFKFFRV